MGETVFVPRERGADSRVVIGGAKENLNRLLPEGRVIVVSDSTVYRYHRDLIGGYEYVLLEEGETHKSPDTLVFLWRRLLEMGADRKTFLLGIGGGIVTDITGFAASTYMRGIRFGFVATTLLAQVDASVGGKNGVNLDGFKNIVGVFNQPEFVVCDISMLDTLPEREFRAGLSEIVKAGIIADRTLFELLETHSYDGLRNDHELLQKIVARAIRVKADVVARDEREAGERRKLNLGHTFAHAIEKCSRACSHGEAVAAGLAIVSRAAVRAGKLDEADARRIVSVLERLGLPVESPVEVRRLCEVIAQDKKREEDHLFLVLPTGIPGCDVIPMALSEIEVLVS